MLGMTGQRSAAEAELSSRDQDLLQGSAYTVDNFAFVLHNLCYNTRPCYSILECGVRCGEGWRAGDSAVESREQAAE